MTWRAPDPDPRKRRAAWEARAARARQKFTPPAGHIRKEDDMARGKKAREPKDDASEVKPMDFERAKKLYIHDIKPAKSEASSQGQTVAEAMKVIKKQCHIEPQGARKAFSAFEMEDAHRETHVRSFVGMFNALMGREVLTCSFGDLVDQAQGLATLGDGDPDEDEADPDVNDFEAPAEELAAQVGRGKPRKASIPVIQQPEPVSAVTH